MTPAQVEIIARITEAAITERNVLNNAVRNKFGDRITVPLASECETRDREIEALEANLAMIRAAD